MALGQIKPTQKLVGRCGDNVRELAEHLGEIFEDLDTAITAGGTFEACADARDRLKQKVGPLLKQLLIDTTLGPNADAGGRLTK